jgi:hypothetical protein
MPAFTGSPLNTNNRGDEGGLRQHFDAAGNHAIPIQFANGRSGGDDRSILGGSEPG